MTILDNRLKDEARKLLERKAALLRAADVIESVQAVKGMGGLAAIVDMLQESIAHWTTVGCWEQPLDPIAQAKALRSREILEYLSATPEKAEELRAQAEKIARLVDTAVQAGRISPTIERNA